MTPTPGSATLSETVHDPFERVNQTIQRAKDPQERVKHTFERENDPQERVNDPFRKGK
jgi:hypothetical protein